MTTHPLETTRRLTPLGIDFWDFLTELRITDGLSATAHPLRGSGSPVRGQRTPSGVIAFHGLPGLRDAEYPDPDGAPGLLPSEPSADFDIVVRDGHGRFNDVAVGVSAPLLGLVTAADALGDCSAAAFSFPGDAPLFLFSAPSRSLPPGVGAIRAQVFGRVMGGPEELQMPAAHAVLKVTVAGQVWLGVADAMGTVLVPVPYPAFAGGFSGSLGESIPAGSHGTPTNDQLWPVTVEVWSQPDALQFPKGSAVPRLGSVLCQGTAGIWLDPADPAPQPDLAAELRFGRDLILFTGTDETRRDLLIDWP